jgi:hypothetical protein
MQVVQGVEGKVRSNMELESLLINVKKNYVILVRYIRTLRIGLYILVV